MIIHVNSFGSGVCLSWNYLVAFAIPYLGVMSSTDRLDWLTQQISAGRSAYVRFSFNPNTRTEKITFVLQPWEGTYAPTYRPALLNTLLSLRVSMFDNIVTDKGHTHKSQPGSTFIEFWIKTPQTQEANADSTVDVETDATENALPSLPDQFPNSLHSAIEGLAPEVSVNIAPATTTGSTDAVDHVANMQERIDELQSDMQAQVKKLESIVGQKAQACDSTASASAAADIPSEASVSTAYSKEYLSKLASSGSDKTDKVINLIIN